MTPEITITILFTVLGFYVIEYFVSKQAKSIRENYIKQLQQTHQEELKKVQDKLSWATSEIQIKTSGIDNLIKTIENWNSKCSSLESELQALEKDRDAWNAVSEGLQTEYDSMRNERNNWMQETKEWKSRADAWAEECTNWEETHKRTIVEIEALEKELDRGNELIKWMKADLRTAYAIIKEQEAVLESLGIKAPSRLDGSEPKQLRSVESLTTDYAIVCNDETELNAVLKKFEEAGKVWFNGGEKPTQWKPDGGWNLPNFIGTRHNNIYQWCVEATNLIPASDFVQIEPTVNDGIDWSKPVPFPEDYRVPKGVKVVVVSEDRYKGDDCYRPIGIKGVTTESCTVPYCDWEDGKKRIHMICDELAPINPTDHPNHPQFKG